MKEKRVTREPQLNQFRGKIATNPVDIIFSTNSLLELLLSSNGPSPHVRKFYYPDSIISYTCYRVSIYSLLLETLR
jgi:hypothetical protein